MKPKLQKCKKQIISVAVRLVVHRVSGRQGASVCIRASARNLFMVATRFRRCLCSENESYACAPYDRSQP
jgi:hypothetical protein